MSALGVWWYTVDRWMLFSIIFLGFIGLFFSLVFRIFTEVKHKKINKNDEKEADVKDLLDKMTEVKDAISKDDDSSLLYQMKSFHYHY